MIIAAIFIYRSWVHLKGRSVSSDEFMMHCKLSKQVRMTNFNNAILKSTVFITQIPGEYRTGFRS